MVPPRCILYISSYTDFKAGGLTGNGTATCDLSVSLGEGKHDIKSLSTNIVEVDICVVGDGLS